MQHRQAQWRERLARQAQGILGEKIQRACRGQARQETPRDSARTRLQSPTPATK